MITHPDRSILGPIPDDWDTIQLRNCLKASAAGDWGDEHGDVMLSVLRSTNFTDSRDLDFTDVALRGFSAKDSDKFSMLAEDILVERSGGGPAQPVGRVVTLERDLPGFGFSNFVQQLRIDQELMNPDYVAWCLYRLHASGIIERLQHQTTQMRNLDFRDYVKILLPRPSPEEQQSVSDLMLSMDYSIRVTNDELRKALRLKVALLQQLFTTGLPGRHSQMREGQIFKSSISYPALWSFERLGQSILFADYGTNSPANDSQIGYPVIAIPQVISSVLTRGDWPYADLSEKEAMQLKLDAGDVLLIRTNGNPEYIGKSTVISEELAQEHLVFASYLIRARTNQKRLLGEYLNLFLASPLGRRQCLALANTSAGNHNLGARSLKQILIPRPPIHEQEDALKLVRFAEETITSIHQKVDALERMKTSLLQNLLTGRIRLKEAAAT